MAESTMRTLKKCKGIILCDVNDTILNPDFVLTASKEDLKKAIACAQKNGFLVGLASNNPAADLAKSAFDWGMEGPIIVENGAGIMLTAADEISGVQEWNRSFSELQNLFSDAIQLCDIEKLGYRLVSGDSQHIVRNPKSGDWIDKSIDTIVIMVEKRSYSLAFFVRTRHTTKGYKGEWSVDVTELRHFAEIAKKVIAFSSHAHRYRTTLYEDIGLCVIAGKDSTKQRGLHLLREYFGYDMPVSMIGSSMKDFLGNDVEHFAIGNASVEYRDHCEYFTGADSKYTDGVIHILDNINRTRQPKRT